MYKTIIKIKLDKETFNAAQNASIFLNDVKLEDVNDEYEEYGWLVFDKDLEITLIGLLAVDFKYNHNQSAKKLIDEINRAH